MLAVDLIRRYFGLFSTKACCFEDLKPFLSLSPDDIAAIVEFVKTNIGQSHVSVSSLQSTYPPDSFPGKSLICVPCLSMLDLLLALCFGF